MAMAKSLLEAADAAFERALSSRDEGEFGAAIEHYTSALDVELEQDRAEGAEAATAASVKRVVRCYGRRALARLHLADGLTMQAVSTHDVEDIANPYLRLALEDSMLGLEVDSADETLHHTAAVTNEHVKRFTSWRPALGRRPLRSRTVAPESRRRYWRGCSSVASPPERMAAAPESG